MSVFEILVIKPSSLGDVLHTLPAVAALKQTFPQSRIRWIINTEWQVLLDDNPHVDQVIPFPRRQFRGVRAFLRYLSWCRSLAGLRPGLVLDFQGLLRSAWIARSSGAQRIYGLADAREGARIFYDRVAPVSRDQHAVERYLSLARLAGADTGRPLDFRLPTGKPFAALPLPSPLVVLHPFARGKGKSLSLPEITLLREALLPLQTVVIGRGASSRGAAADPLWLVDQTDLAQLIWLLRNADFVVSVDSGPMHLAAALSHKLLAIHFWSNPAQVGPYRKDAFIWYNNQIFAFAEVSQVASSPYNGQRPAPIEIADFVRAQLALG